MRSSPPLCVPPPAISSLGVTKKAMLERNATETSTAVPETTRSRAAIKARRRVLRVMKNSSSGARSRPAQDRSHVFGLPLGAAKPPGRGDEQGDQHEGGEAVGRPHVGAVAVEGKGVEEGRHTASRSGASAWSATASASARALRAASSARARISTTAKK